MPKIKSVAKEHWDPVPVAKELVSQIYGDIVEERCVVFVGSGSTTERPKQERKNFYESIKELADFPGDRPSFPELMQYFCDRKDGGHHNRLIRKALSRIELYCIPGEDNYAATAFTDALSRIPYLNRFVTTNWDPFLERSLDVLVPMVEDRDLAFWDDHKRQVLKIHGCITRPYSIVATQGDYDKCMSGNPLIFNKLKDLMATKTFLFSGYSMRDPDFKVVWDLINSSLGRFGHLAFAIDPGATQEQMESWKGRGIRIFKTMDTTFIHELREKLEKEGLIPSERFVKFLERERTRIVSTHLAMHQDSDGKFASAMYQDGILHELDDVISATKLGTKKKEDFENDHGETLRCLQEMHRRKDGVEIAYYSGRAEVLERFNGRRGTSIPTFFHPYKLHPVSALVTGKKFR